MENEPERLPERQAPPRPPTANDLARLAESRRALDQRSEPSPPEPRETDAAGGAAVHAGDPPPSESHEASHPGDSPPSEWRETGAGDPATGSADQSPPGSRKTDAGGSATDSADQPPPAGPGAGRTGPPGSALQPVVQQPGPRPPGSSGSALEPAVRRTAAALPPPRAGDRLPVPVRRQQPPAPMSDMTTTMPILDLPIVDPDTRSAPPGMPGHFHTETDNGRHRGGARVPRGLLVVFGIAAVVGVGLVTVGALDSGSSDPTPDSQAGAPAHPSGATSPRPDPNPSTDVAQGLNDSATPDPSGSSSPTPSRTPRTPTNRPTATPTPTGAGDTTQPGAPGRVTATPTRSTPSSPAPSSSTATPTPTPTPTTAPFTPLSKGATGPAVSDMQHLLDQAGYMPWSYQDGTFDRTTYYAVAQFQADYGTGSDGYGVYGVATHAALLKATGQGL